MKLLTFIYQGKEQVGVLSRDEKIIHPIADSGLEYTSINELICNITTEKKEMLSRYRDEKEIGGIAVQEVDILAPIPYPRQDIICLGINYMDHAKESANFRKKDFSGERPFAVYFSKRVNRAIGDKEIIDSHSDLMDSLDYEVELAFIIGKDAKNVEAENVKDYIFGYTIMNDMSGREIQTRHMQWYFGKSLDGFTPLGPCIVTADDIPYPPELTIQSRVNGESRQLSNTKMLIFGIDHIVSELSKGMTLKAGTIIATGTPAGVGMGFDPPRYLKVGDRVECEIEGIGCITNTIGEIHP